MPNVFKTLALAITQKDVLSPVDNRGGWWPVIRETFAGAWQRNIEWRVDDVISYPTVYACITIIANDIGKLRHKLVQKDGNGIWTEIDSAAFSPVLRRPNRYQNHIQFKQQWIMSKMLRGNTYALKQRDNRGVVTALYILDPQRVQVLVSDEGDVYYQLSQDNLTGLAEVNITVPASEIIHDRMNCLYHPLVGVSPLFAAGVAANIGLKIQGNSAIFFGNGSNPSGILVAPGTISEVSAKALKDHWDTNFTGANAGKVAVIGDGMKFEQMRMTSVDAQLIETLKWADEKICSVFHVPPYKVGVGAAPSYNNIEALAQEYYNTCLQVLIEEYEAAMDFGLGLDGVQKGVELDLDGLLRMDSKTQMETLGVGVEKKILTINSARLRVNQPPLLGGNTVYLQQQDFPLDQIRNNKLPEAAPTPALPAPQPAAVEEPGDGTAENEEQMRAFMQKMKEGFADA